jgi:hypothetical protein
MHIPSLANAQRRPGLSRLPTTTMARKLSFFTPLHHLSHATNLNNALLPVGFLFSLVRASLRRFAMPFPSLVYIKQN